MEVAIAEIARGVRGIQVGWKTEAKGGHSLERVGQAVHLESKRAWSLEIK